MPTTTDYTDRTRDLCIYTNFDWADAAMQAVDISLNGIEGGLICSGTVKLAQKVLIALLSYGSAYDTVPSSLLAEYLQTGESRPARLYSAITIAFTQTKAYINNNLPDDAPDDERVSSIKLVEWNYDRAAGSLDIEIEVYSVGGSNFPLLIPLNVGTIT